MISTPANTHPNRIRIGCHSSTPVKNGLLLPSEVILDLDLNKAGIIKILEDIIKQNGILFNEQITKPFSERLQKKITEIKKDTTGLIAWFRYLFRRGLQAEKLQHAASLENLRDLILNHGKSESPRRIDLSDSETDEEMDDTGSVSSGSESPKTPTELDSGSSDISDKSEATRPSASSFAPPPPPPPGAIPPPPPPGIGLNTPTPPKGGPAITTPLVTLTPEEKHIQWEQKKLDNKLKERTNPAKFYKMTPPSNKKELEKLIAEKQTNIEAWKGILISKDPQSKEKAKEIIQKETAALEKLEKELEGSLLPVKNSSPEFREKVALYTNAELKILLMIYFLEEEPQKGIFNLSKNLYASNDSYRLNQVLFDQMFVEWGVLSKTKSGTALLEYRDEWKRYMVGTSIMGFLDTLKSRMEGRKPVPEPVYEIPPYTPKKAGTPLKTTSPRAAESEQSTPLNIVDALNAIKKGGSSILRRPRSNSERIPPTFTSSRQIGKGDAKK